MSIIIIFGIGAAVGLVFAFLVPDDGKPRPFINVATAIIGAILGGIPAAQLLSAKHYRPDVFDFDIGVWSFSGAILLLLVAKLIGRAISHSPDRG